MAHKFNSQPELFSAITILEFNEVRRAPGWIQITHLRVFQKVAYTKLENSNWLTIEKIPLNGSREGLVNTLKVLM